MVVVVVAHQLSPCRDSLAGKGIAYDHRAQLQNCMLADAVLSQWHVSAKQGVPSFYWPCRMETFRFKTSSPPGSAADLSSAGSSKAHEQLIVLDGCHNGDSIQVFLQSLAEKYPEHQKLIVFGAGMEKSIDMMIRALFLHSDKVVFVQSQHFKSYTEAQLLSKVPAAVEAGAGDSFHRKIAYLPTLESTLRGTVALRLLHCIRSLRSPVPSGALPVSTSSASVASPSASLQSNRPTVIGVCGSLFVAADAREALYRYVCQSRMPLLLTACDRSCVSVDWTPAYSRGTTGCASRTRPSSRRDRQTAAAPASFSARCRIRSVPCSSSCLLPPLRLFVKLVLAARVAVGSRPPRRCTVLMSITDPHTCCTSITDVEYDTTLHG